MALQEQDIPRVFPTPVGVFPQTGLLIDQKLGLPHARGGVSIISEGGKYVEQSSPRPWGCF